jgi:hypothetical protein
MINEDEFQKYVNKEKIISSANEYWELHKYWKKKINKMTLNVVHFIKTPKQYSDDYEKLLDEGFKSQLITEEFKNHQLEKFYKELNTPTRFKADAKAKLEKIKNKLKLSSKC